MERCNTCEHWIPENKNYPLGDLRKEQGDGGQCVNGKLCEDWGKEAYTSDSLVYPYNEGAKSFWTGAEFGCVHHKRRTSVESENLPDYLQKMIEEKGEIRIVDRDGMILAIYRSGAVDEKFWGKL